MKLVVVCIAFEMIDDLLPVCGENVSIIAMKALVDLVIASAPLRSLRMEESHTFAQAPV